MFLFKVLFDTKNPLCYDSAVLNQLSEGLFRIIFPANCLQCQRHIPPTSIPAVLCEHCLAAIELNRRPFCHKCSRPTATDALCPQCLSCRPVFDRAWGCSLYLNKMPHLFYLFKYGQKTALRGDFGKIIARFIHKQKIDLSRFEFLMPIPLHPTRLRERRYNQSELLAQELQRLVNIPIMADNLRRTRFTRFQATLTPKERFTNMRGAFRINQPERVKKRSILLVDDLLTTTATASQAARVLKEHGAKYVGVLTLAITP